MDVINALTADTQNVYNQTLSDDQQEALVRLSNFVFNDNKLAFSLIGKPGTGKTFLIKEFIKYLDKKRYNSYVICAPTHKAASVLKEGIGKEVKTIHQFLSLSPKMDILDFDLRNLFFTQTDVDFNDKLIICDEASMINDDLYDHLVKRCKDRGAKIIFIGDIKQLQPVKSLTLSKVFSLDNRFELTHNHRQKDSELVSLIEDSRISFISEFDEYESENCDLFKSAREMMTVAIDNFKMQSMLEFVQFCKVLTYTNDRVEKFNRYIHSNITNDEYCFNELLTGYSNHNLYINNSEDYLVKDVNLSYKLLPGLKQSVMGYQLKLKNLTSGEMGEVFILPRETDKSFLEHLAYTLEDFRTNAVNRKISWKNYYSLDKSFAIPFNLEFDSRIIKQKTLDYGYAMTIHKSQSSTYDVVYFDNNSLQYCYNPDEKRQLQYVALSRVKEKLNILI